MSHVTIQIQSQGAHGKVLKALHSTWNLSVCLQRPVHQRSLLVPGLSGQWGSQGRGGGHGPLGPGRKAHLLIQAHEAQGIAGIPHLVHNTWAKHRGREGDVDGPVVSSWDDLTRIQKPHVHWQARAAPRENSYPHILTTCLGLIWYMWSEGTALCPCRMTEMICSSALVPQLWLPCYQ